MLRGYLPGARDGGSLDPGVGPSLYKSVKAAVYVLTNVPERMIPTSTSILR